MKFLPALLTAALSCCVISQPADAKSAKIDRAGSQRAMTALLAASDEVIPASSSCHGLFGGESPARVKDLLAMELATLSRGRNVVTGHCDPADAGDGAQCAISITHDFGEDVSSADIRFRTQAGRADAQSLACVLTP